MTTVAASFEYLRWTPLYEKQKPYEVFLPLAKFGDKKETVPRSNLAFETRSTTVQDVRGREASYRLDEHGFQFAKHATAVSNLCDADAVDREYVPEMQAFLADTVLAGEGPVRTFCFDVRVRLPTLPPQIGNPLNIDRQLRRNIDPAVFSSKVVNLEDGFDPLLPATHPHVDQSTTGAIRRVQRHLGDEADALLKGRVRIIKSVHSDFPVAAVILLQKN